MLQTILLPLLILLPVVVIGLTVDDTSCRTVHSGDQVVVIKSKEVTVNGKPRHTD